MKSARPGAAASLIAVERRMREAGCGDNVARLAFLLGIDEPRYLSPFTLSANRKHDSSPCEEILLRLSELDRRSPGLARTHALRGRVLRALDRGTQALEAFDRALKLSPGDGRTLGWRGELLLHMEGVTARSLADLSSAARALPDSPWPSVWAAAALLSTAATPEVFTALDAALAVAPGHVPALFLRAVANERCGRPENALVDAALAARLAPKCAGALILRGRLAARCGRNEAAIASFAAATRLEPDAKAFYSELIVSGQSRDKGRFGLEQLDAYIRKFPQTAWAYALRGDLKRTSAYDHMEAGMADLERAVELDPETPWIRACLARSYVQYGHIAPGMKALRAALQQDPRCAWLHSWLGESYREHERPADAVRHFRRAIALDPRFAQVHLWLGRVQCESGLLRQGIREFTRAIRIDCDYGFAYFKRGRALAELGRHAEAIGDFERALVLRPREPQTIRTSLEKSRLAVDAGRRA